MGLLDWLGIFNHQWNGDVNAAMDRLIADYLKEHPNATPEDIHELEKHFGEESDYDH